MIARANRGGHVSEILNRIVRETELPTDSLPRLTKSKGPELDEAYQERGRGARSGREHRCHPHGVRHVNDRSD
ncbi:hypothetical protein ACVWWN_000437 [Mycobacterium sp. URHB0021]